MKKIIRAFFLSSMISSAQAQIRFDTSKHLLDIRYDNNVRLINGVSIMESDKAGTIETSIKNNVALLSVALSDTIGATQFAGVFFNNIRDLKQGVTLWR